MKLIQTGKKRSDAQRKIFVQVDNADFDFLSQFHWQVDSTNNIKAHGIGLMARLIMQAPKNLEVDHIDGNRLNNQRSNLRLATSSQNKCNRGPRKDNKSGFKGVSLHKQTKKWSARIKTPYGKYLSLGLYHNKFDAAKAYNKAAMRYHGEFAFINKIKDY